MSRRYAFAPEPDVEIVPIEPSRVHAILFRGRFAGVGVPASHGSTAMLDLSDWFVVHLSKRGGK